MAVVTSPGHGLSFVLRAGHRAQSAPGPRRGPVACLQVIWVVLAIPGAEGVPTAFSEPAVPGRPFLVILAVLTDLDCRALLPAVSAATEAFVGDTLISPGLAYAPEDCFQIRRRDGPGALECLFRSPRLPRDPVPRIHRTLREPAVQCLARWYT